jgi:adenylylsulfate kinase-like enzyme
VAITAAISPYRAIRDEARAQIGPFVEVFVRCPLDVLVQRDTKGLYAKALRGEIAQFTGVSDPYEEPFAAEVVVETDLETIEESTPRCCASSNRWAISHRPTARSRRMADS